jgi:uncharacterized protein YjbI with pentapeptide repeats
MKHTRESILALIDECRKNGTRVYLSGQDLSGLNLQGAYLQGANLQWANLQKAYLQEANLQKANLQGAYLRMAYLQEANLQKANLRDANLDYCGIEMSCRTIGLKIDKRLVSQLLYHLCSMDVSYCPEWDELRNDERVIALANQSHVIPVHNLPEIKQINAQEEEK